MSKGVCIAVFMIAAMMFPYSNDGVCDSMLKTKIEEGIAAIGSAHRSEALAVITDAGYVVRNGATTEGLIDFIAGSTGCSAGRGNLLFLHRRADYRLFVALYDRNTGKCAVISDNNGGYSLSAAVSISLESVSDDAGWDAASQAIGNSDAYGVVMLFHAWAARIPYDFLKCVELHNHVCPGVTSGYFIARYMLEEYPLRSEDRWSYVSCPPWCKDDAIQTLLDITPGKKNFFVKLLPEDHMAHLKSPDAAGIFVIRHTDGSGTAVVPVFDWERASELSGAADLKGIPQRIVSVTGLLPYFDTPGALVRIVHESPVTAEQIERLPLAGVNPYEEIGFVK